MTEKTSTPIEPTASAPLETTALPSLETAVPPQDVQVGPGWEPSKIPASKFLLPKVFPTEAQFLYLPSVVPKIQITQLALLKVFIVLSTIEMEVGWLGTAKRDGDNITIDDIFLFEQDVSYGHTEISTDSMANVMQEVLQRPGGEEIFNNIRFWGHSHGNGGTDPSHQDNQTMKTFEKFGADFFLRGIFNRVGGASFSLFDWQNNVAFHNAPWKVVGKSITSKMYKQLLVDLPSEMQRKVTYTRPVYAPQKTYKRPIFDLRRLFTGG